MYDPAGCHAFYTLQFGQIEQVSNVLVIDRGDDYVALAWNESIGANLYELTVRDAFGKKLVNATATALTSLIGTSAAHLSCVFVCVRKRQRDRETHTEREQE
jgi:hypothetical protein